MYNGHMDIITKEEARILGRKHYFTGKKCRNGHLSTRYVNCGSCTECIKNNSAISKDRNPEYGKNWRTKNRERMLQYHRDRRSSDLEGVRRYYREIYRKNSEHAKKYVSEYQKSNPEKVREWKKKWENENKDTIIERTREYRKKNPEWARLQGHKRRALNRNAPGSFTVNDIKTIKENQKSLCPYCKTSIEEKYHIDHIVALVNGGSNFPGNLQLLCPSCNVKKNRKSHEKFLIEIGS